MNAEDLDIDTWFLPTMFGDIRLLKVDDDHTRLQLCKLTRAELDAVNALREHSLKKGFLRKPWATEDTWKKIPEAFTTGRPEESEVILDARIYKVESFLSKHLRKGRETITVATTSVGEYVEITARYDDENGKKDSPYREDQAPPKKKEPKPKPAAAVTVAQPVRGCPAPDFEDRRVRATEALHRFLSPEQVQDFERKQQFVTFGALTGHRYVITSRHCRSLLHTHTRTVYDLDDDCPYCVHDWEIPAPEECLTMHLLLSLPQWEGYIRGMQE